MIIDAERYQAALLPPQRWMRQTPVMVEKAQQLLDAVVRHESFFTDYERACEEVCGRCQRCMRAKKVAAYTLTKPDSMVWEVWSKDGVSGELLDFIGILRLSQVREGCNALAHYFFFDGVLSDKTALLEAWREWIFSDHDGWRGLHRVSIEVPEFAFALARHAQNKLGFGGPFEYSNNGTTLRVEGVRRDAVRWRGDWHDSIFMGLTANGIA